MELSLMGSRRPVGMARYVADMEHVDCEIIGCWRRRGSPARHSVASMSRLLPLDDDGELGSGRPVRWALLMVCQFFIVL